MVTDLMNAVPRCLPCVSTLWRRQLATARTELYGTPGADARRVRAVVSCARSDRGVAVVSVHCLLPRRSVFDFAGVFICRGRGL